MPTRCLRLAWCACCAIALGCHSRDANVATSAAGDADALRLVDADSQWSSPFAPGATAYVFLFARFDCPISNRYAPEVRRLAEKFAASDVRFALVYPDPNAARDEIDQHLRDFKYLCPGYGDPHHRLVDRVGATVTPEAAVFDSQQRLVYCGRIDDRFVALGQERAQPTTHDLEAAIQRVLASDAGPSGQCVRTPAIGCYIGDLR